MRLYFLTLLFITSSSVFSMNYEIQPPEKEVVFLNSYLDSINTKRARIKSKCKDDDCRYWLTIGNKRKSVDKSTKVITQGRYISDTLVIIKNSEGVQIIDSNFGYQKIQGEGLLRCLSTSHLAVGISIQKDALCITSDYLFAGNKEIKLPAEALYATVGISYRGHWQTAFVGADYNVYVGNHKGFDKIEVGLNDQSDLKDILSLFPLSSTQSLLSVYVYQNKRNKSLILYRLSNLHSKIEMKKEFITVINSIETDVGLNPMVYINQQDEIVVTSKAKTGDYQYTIKSSSFNNTQNYSNPYQNKDTLDLLIGTSIRHTNWSINQKVKSPNHESSDLAKTQYHMNQSLLKEIIIQGKLMGNPIALQYAKNEATKKLGIIEKAAAERFYGYIGFKDIFKGASTLRLEFRQESVGGIADWKNESNTTTSTRFINNYTQYSALKTEEQGFYKGVSYTNNNLPMAVAFFDNQKSNGQVYFDSDLEIKKLSLSFGYDESQYASRYLFDHKRFYLSPRFSVGIFQYNINKDIIKSAESYFGKKLKTEIGFSMDGSIELGYLWQKRSANWGGSGGSLQVGLSIDAEFYLNDIGSEDEIADNEIAASFNRSDYRYGPFARLNIIF